MMNIFMTKIYSQSKDINYFLNVSLKNNPSIKTNANLVRINLLQNDLIIAQNKKPQIYFSSDYLFAPYFKNNGRFISITPNPNPDAFGYDPSVTNGGLYEALLNIDIPLLTSGVSGSLVNQNKVQNQILLLSSGQILHDVDSQVREQYISTYSIQEQINYLENIMSLIDGRKKIVDVLVQKGLMQQTDYLILDIEQDKLFIEQHNQKKLLADAFTQLNNICGMEDTTQFELAAPEIKQSQPVKSFKFMERYKIDSLNISSQLEVLETNFKPQLNLFGNMGLRSTDPSNIEHHFGLGIGLHLNVPIYNGNQKNIQLQQNHISFDTLNISRNLQIVNVKNSLNGLQKQIKIAEETIALNQTQINKQETLLNILQDKLISGQISTIDYVKSLEDYVLTNQNLFNARISLWHLINQYNYLNW